MYVSRFKLRSNDQKTRLNKLFFINIFQKRNGHKLNSGPRKSVEQTTESCKGRWKLVVQTISKWFNIEQTSDGPCPHSNIEWLEKVQTYQYKSASHYSNDFFDITCQFLMNHQHFGLLGPLILATIKLMTIDSNSILQTKCLKSVTSSVKGNISVSTKSRVHQYPKVSKSHNRSKIQVMQADLMGGTGLIVNKNTLRNAKALKSFPKSMCCRLPDQNTNWMISKIIAGALHFEQIFSPCPWIHHNMPIRTNSSVLNYKLVNLFELWVVG